jgi:hypothetical protein
MLSTPELHINGDVIHHKPTNNKFVIKKAIKLAQTYE